MPGIIGVANLPIIALVTLVLMGINVLVMVGVIYLMTRWGAL